MSSMNILFVVCGEGLGHASRSTKLAKHLKAQGMNCAFAAYGKAYSFIQKQTDCPVYEIPREVTLEGTGGYFSIKKTISSSIGIPVSLVRSFYGRNGSMPSSAIPCFRQVLRQRF